MRNQNNSVHCLKTLFLFTFILLGISMKAQFTLEHTYDSASTLKVGTNPLNQLMIVDFEVSGPLYVNINRWGKIIQIYNLNHSLNRTISLSNLPLGNSPYLGYILYLSETLFNTDSLIEFMYCTSFNDTNGNAQFLTNIYNEKSVLLFTDTALAAVDPTYPMQQYPIYNTPLGTKMILSKTNGQAQVWGLQGTLPAGLQEVMQQQIQNGKFSNLYPNPSNGSVTIQYQLPPGEHSGEIVLYNTRGAELKRYKVDDTFTDLILDNSTLQSGTYFYQLITNSGVVGIKKMVVIK